MSKEGVRIIWAASILGIWLIGIAPGNPESEIFFSVIFAITLIWGIFSAISHPLEVLFPLSLILVWGILRTEWVEVWEPKFSGWTITILAGILIYSIVRGAKKKPQEKEDLPKRKELDMLPTEQYPFNQDFSLFTRPMGSFLPSIPENAEAALAKSDPETARDVLLKQAETNRDIKAIELMKEGISKMIDNHPEATGIEVNSGIRAIRVGFLGRRQERYVQVKLII